MNITLLTDFYQITMAYAYWKRGMAEEEAIFHHSFRSKPFKGGYAVFAGLQQFIEYIESFTYTTSDIDYLRDMQGNDGQQLFEEGFLVYLLGMKFTCNIDAVPEGTVVFPHEPLVRVQGPVLQCQLLETPLLNLLNFPTLIATKASRIVLAAEGDEVLEFGLRRAQGVNGALTASRAAYIGGCSSTSNVLAGKLYDIPVRGTQAHSWVMLFDEEEEAFRNYAEAMPNNCILLVDTYDTLEGVSKAIRVGKWLESRGGKFVGIRLDSGDFTYLSIESRKLLDSAGFTEALIVASNDLDENIIADLKRQGARIDVWGVGTNLVTAKDQPALNGVYKLAAVRNGEGWDYKIKLSEQMEKISNPGILQVRRYYFEGQNIADAIYDLNIGLESNVIVDPMDSTRRKDLPKGVTEEDLLQPIYREGTLVYDIPSLLETRQRTIEGLSGFHSGVKRFVNPHQYVVGLELDLYRYKIDLINKIRSKDESIISSRCSE